MAASLFLIPKAERGIQQDQVSTFLQSIVPLGRDWDESLREGSSLCQDSLPEAVCQAAPSAPVKWPVLQG